MLTLCITLFLAQPHDAESVAQTFGMIASDQCRSCHPRHFREWLGSVHAFARRDFTLPHGSFAPRSEFEREVEDQNCSGCHGGSLVDLLGRDPLRHPVRLDHGAERTISCTVCHQITESLQAHVSGVSNSEHDCDPRSPEERMAHSFHQNTKPVDLLRRTEFCGPCHELKAPNGLQVERTFSQFLASDYTQRRITCTTCHMTSYGGTVVSGGEFREQVHRHDIIGTDVFANPVPALGSQRRRVASFLSAAASLFVHVPPVVVPGKELELDVDVVNSGAGHNFPAGFPAERRLWLEVDVISNSGELLHVSGRSQRLESEEEDFQPVVFHDRYLDESGAEVPFWWQATSIEERSLRALERRSSRYEFPVSEDFVPGESLRIEVRLRFQACSPRQLRLRGLESLIGSYPIFDVQVYRSDPIPIVARLLPKDTIRVPTDLADIQAALDRVPEGGTVLVEPGDYVLGAPLDFHGKRASLVSRDGRDVTSIRLAGTPEDGDPRSVVVFRSGESRATVLEGFTIRAGGGTLQGDVSHGGAIFCHEASPVLRSLRLLSNRASGHGGGAYFSNSGALFEDVEVEENRAEGDGGGIFVQASPGFEARGASIFANRSLGSGGGVFARGRLELSFSLVQGNRAGRGGGLALESGDTGRARVQKVWILGNGAPIGGGIALKKCAPFFEHVLIAGNAARFGGGVYLNGEGHPELVNVTLTENRGVSGGALRLRGDAIPRIRNSIVFNNQKPGLVGNLSFSLVEDSTGLSDSNVAGLPFFAQNGEWIDCESVEEPGCIPVRWSPGRPPEASVFARFVPGHYNVLAGSPAINIGSPHDSADPDGSRRDAGAIHHSGPSHGFIRGDISGDRKVDLDDVTALVEVVFAHERLVCEDAGDVDDDARITPLDVYFLTAYCYRHARAPGAPFPICGVDRTLDDGLGCFESASECP